MKSICICPKTTKTSTLKIERNYCLMARVKNETTVESVECIGIQCVKIEEKKAHSSSCDIILCV